jgi:F-type H+-transporting ATPase subunit gamma
MLASRPYSAELGSTLHRVATRAADEHGAVPHPLLAVHEPRRVLLVVMTSDRGLCGAFNSNIFRQARTLHAELSGRSIAPEYVAHGRKAAAAIRRAGWPVTKAYLGVSDKPAYARAEEIGGALIARYLAGEIDEAHVVYSSFASRTAQVPCTVRLLPMAAPAVKGAAAAPGEAAARRRAWYIFHPGAAEILAAVLPLALKNSVFTAMLDTTAGEHAARRLAMKNATDAADEMIGALTRAYNRARQYKITQEIAEIVGGVEAQG